MNTHTNNGSGGVGGAAIGIGNLAAGILMGAQLWFALAWVPVNDSIAVHLTSLGWFIQSCLRLALGAAVACALAAALLGANWLLARHVVVLDRRLVLRFAGAGGVLALLGATGGACHFFITRPWF